MAKKNTFLDLNVPVFYNKKNGQISISLPKKKIKFMMTNKNDDDMPKEIPIRLFNWFGKNGGKK